MPKFASLKDTWKSVEPRGQLTLVVSFLLIGITAYFLFSYATKPSYTTLQTGLSPTETNRVTQALAGAGVPYKVSDGGTQVSVVSSQVSAGQVALASAGVGPGSQPGLDSFTKTSLGTTNAQQQAMYQLGLQGDIERQIESITGVSSAQVQIVMPTDTLFADQASQATASVLLDTDSTFDPGAVSGIAHMVASGVQGLSAQNVTVTDQTGAMLWPGGGVGADGSPTASSKLAVQQSYDSQLAAQVDALLVQTLGPGKGQAQVSADLNMDQVTSDSVNYDGTKVPLTSQTSNEHLQSANGSTSGVAGTGANIPPVYSAATGGAKGLGTVYLNTGGSTTYGDNKTVSHTVVAPGAVNQLHVALLFDSSVPAKAQQALRATVQTMVGLNPSRGDTISTASVPFQKAAATGAAGAGPLGAIGVSSPLSLVRDAVIGLASLVFLFLVRRNLKKREGEPRFAEPTWLREISQATPIAALEAAGGERVRPAGAQRRDRIHKEAEEIVTKQPEHVALQVQQWMNES
jgi:flagellar M-ring protein FliF